MLSQPAQAKTHCVHLRGPQNYFDPVFPVRRLDAHFEDVYGPASRTWQLAKQTCMKFPSPWHTWQRAELESIEAEAATLDSRGANKPTPCGKI